MPSQGLTVAVTGPTGDLGIAIVSALERARRVKKVVGMARRPFDPGELGWKKTEYTQGDVTDAKSVKSLVKGADVVIHLAFAILSAGEATRKLNVDGSRNVFKAAADAGAERLLYASSVAAYGFHDDNPDWLTEEVPARGSPEHHYSQQKAEVEEVLADVLKRRRKTVAYAFRPCIVSGPRAQTLLEEIPYYRLSEAMPEPVRSLMASMPVLKPVIPDPGTPFQLVHEDDVGSALLAAVSGKGEPGIYNLAADGEITTTDLAHALGWYAMPIPELAVDVTAKVVSRLPLMPARATWVNALRVPVLMDCTKARKELGWEPAYDALGTLAELVHGSRQKGLLSTPRPMEQD